MNGHDPNLQSLELMAHELHSLLPEVVLVGGCAVSLLITDKARPPVRETIDVDLLTEVTPLSNYYKFCEKLRDLGFQEDEEVICRWKKNRLIVDLMPTDTGVLGFTNTWYTLASQTALTSKLPSGKIVRHVTAPLFVATKIESFHGRGKGDFSHHDVEDIVNIVDGREELIDEVKAAPSEVKEFIKQEIDDFLAQEPFVETLSWHLRPQASEQARVELIISRLRTLAGL